MTEPLVSVVIATYNMGQYIGDAIDSILAQEWSNIEVIVIDDGSTDDTGSVLSRYETEPKVRYIATENRGQPKAKNRGVSEAKGDFVAFCDADDVWESFKLTEQMPSFDDPEVGVVYSNVSHMNEHGDRIKREMPYSYHSGWVTNEMMLRNFVPFGTSVIRRECIEKSGAFDDQFPMGIDWDLWLRYSIEWKFVYVPAKTYVYRVWSGQMSGNYRGRYKNAVKIFQKFVSENGDKLSKRLVSRAWADTYCNKGLTIAAAEQTFLEPLTCIMQAIKHDPTYVPAWKGLVKILIRKYE